MQKKVVIITGASSGIGLEAALKFAKEGWTTYAGFRNLSKRDVIAQACKDPSVVKNIEIVELDTTSDESVRKAVSFVIHKEKRIDALINNAGLAYQGPVEAFTQEEIRAQYEVNFIGVIRCMKAVLPMMRSQRSGRIVNISSVVGVSASGFTSLYASSKFALEGLTQGFAEEVAPFGIKAIIIQPGFTKSNFGAATTPASSALPNDPYAAANAKAQAFMQRGLKQYAAETSIVAEVIYRATTDEKPQFRYQCTPGDSAFVAAILNDPIGRNKPFGSKL